MSSALSALSALSAAGTSGISGTAGTAGTAGTVATPDNTDADIYGLESTLLQQLNTNVTGEYDVDSVLASGVTATGKLTTQNKTYNRLSPINQQMQSQYGKANALFTKVSALDNKALAANQDTLNRVSNYKESLSTAQADARAALLKNGAAIQTSLNTPPDCTANPYNIACQQALPSGDWWTYYFNKVGTKYIVKPALKINPSVSKNLADSEAKSLQLLIDQRNAALAVVAQQNSLVADREKKVATCRSTLTGYDTLIDLSIGKMIGDADNNFTFKNLDWDSLSPDGKVYITLI